MIAPELRDCLAAAYPCPAFKGACTSMRHDPERALYPRGYAGGAGRIEEIELVLCIAEPGEPNASTMRLPSSTDATEIPGLIATATGLAFRDRPTPFHKIIRDVLEYCWPGLTFEEKLRRTWITEGVLCSATKTTGPIPGQVERECATRYLTKQLAMMPDAFVIALGGKAAKRLKRAGRAPNATAFAAGRPGANRSAARPSWEKAGRKFQAHLERKAC